MAQQPSATYTDEAFDNLIADEYPIKTNIVTIVSGQDLQRGAVLGKITTGGKYTLSLSASNDGSETPVAVLGEDVDASGGDKNGMIYISGSFNQRKLIFGTGHTAASARDTLKLSNIYVKGSDAA